MKMLDLGDPLLDVEDDERGGHEAHGEDDANGVQQAIRTEELRLSLEITMVFYSQE